eukprot:RCo023149
MSRSPSPVGKVCQVGFEAIQVSWIEDAGPALAKCPVLAIGDPVRGKRCSPLHRRNTPRRPRVQVRELSPADNLVESNAPPDYQEDASISASVSLPLSLPGSPWASKRSSSAVRFLRASPKGRRPTPRMPAVQLLVGVSSSPPEFSTADLLEPTAPRARVEGRPIVVAASLPAPESPSWGLPRHSSALRFFSPQRPRRAELWLSLSEVKSSAPMEAPPVLRGCCGSPLRAARALQWATPSTEST